MPNANPTINRKKFREARAEAYFSLYYQLGAERSLAKVADSLRQVGVKVADSTLENYSSIYHWTQRVVELDTQLQSEMNSRRVKAVADMNERQARAGRNLQALANAGMAGYQKTIAAGKDLDFAPGEIATLLREGSRIERLAMGEATDRSEAVILVWNVMVSRIATIFEQVNIIPDPDARKRQFAFLVDDYKNKELAQLQDAAKEPAQA